MTNLERVTLEYAQAVLDRGKSNLGSYRMVTNGKGRRKKRRSIASGQLRKSLAFRASNTRGGTKLTYFAKGEAANYASFQEEGVNGTQKKHGSPYSFRGKNINTKWIEKWMKSKRMQLREMKNGKLGGFTKGTPAKYKAAAFMIGRSIAKYGITPVEYMKDAFEDITPRWRERFEQALIDDLEAKL